MSSLRLDSVSLYNAEKIVDKAQKNLQKFANQTSQERNAAPHPKCIEHIDEQIDKHSLLIGRLPVVI